MDLGDFAAKTKSCNVELVGGHRVKLTFRPFVLADMAWLQDEFPSEEDQLNIALMKITALCKIIWHQLDSKSKSEFDNITFKEDGDDGKEVTLNAVGYEKLLYAIKEHKNIYPIFDVYSEVEGLNSFMPEKKKTKKQKKAA